jgi:hypothetical protein
MRITSTEQSEVSGFPKHDSFDISKMHHSKIKIEIILKILIVNESGIVIVYDYHIMMILHFKIS